MLMESFNCNSFHSCQNCCINFYCGFCGGNKTSDTMSIWNICYGKIFIVWRNFLNLEIIFNLFTLQTLFAAASKDVYVFVWKVLWKLGNLFDVFNSERFWKLTRKINFIGWSLRSLKNLQSFVLLLLLFP